MVADTDSLARFEMGVPTRALVVGEAFASALPAQDVANAIARGLLAAGEPQPDEIALAREPQLTRQLEDLQFDARLRAARALVLATPELDERTLAGSPAFELATRARQAGVPAYAVTRENRLGAFDARILDLQEIVQATGRRGLQAAGRALAPALSAGRPGTRR